MIFGVWFSGLDRINSTNQFYPVNQFFRLKPTRLRTGQPQWRAIHVLSNKIQALTAPTVNLALGTAPAGMRGIREYPRLDRCQDVI